MRQIPFYADGDTLEASTFNDIPAEEMNAITSAGIALSAGDLYQLAKTIATYVAQSDYYVDSGAADSYILSSTGSLQSPTQYSDGMSIRFIAANTSTGTTVPVVNVNSLGSQNIYRVDGTQIGAGDISATQINEMVYLTAYSGFTLISQSYAGATFTTGDIKPTHKLTEEAGWIIYTADGTIGDASSAATIRANADTENLFLLWWSYSDAICPVTGGRGASAANDWAAHKKIAVPRGSWGAALGTPSATYPLGTAVGASTVTLISTQIPVHNHTATDAGHTHTTTLVNSSNANTGSGAPALFGSPTIPTGTGYASISVGNAGSGASHNNMQPTYFCNWEIKL